MWEVISAVIPVFCAVFAGAALRRLGWLKREADDSLMRLGINLLYPALILGSVTQSTVLERRDFLFIAPVVGFLLVAIGILAARVTGVMLRLNREDNGSFAFAAGMFNYGFIAIPLAFALFGAEVVGALVVFNLGVEIAFWTIGVGTMAGRGKASWRNLLNPPVVAIIVGILLNLAGGRHWLPGPFLRSCEFLGAASIPIALIMTGSVLADVATRQNLHAGWRVGIAAVVLRNGLLPLLFLFIAHSIPWSPELRQVIIIQSAMPAAMAPVMLARYYGVNPIPAMQAIVFTTLAAIVTIPLWIAIGAQM